MRWIPLVLIFIGVFGLAKAVSMDVKSTFDDDSFMIQMALMIAGIACFAAAVIAFFVQWAIGH